MSASSNPVRRLADFGQSPWLDFISRRLIDSGELARLVEHWGLGGVTSNPAIFEKAIAQSEDYDNAIRAAALAGHDAVAIYEALVLDDIGRAADVLRPIHAASRGVNGYVSLEVSPHLVDDHVGTVVEAMRLWTALDRPNVMIKVPGTGAGLAAIEELTAAGVNVNVTLLFSLQRYRAVADAFVTGLERAREAGRPIDSIASVASFFLSRIDTIVDRRLEPIIAEGDGRAAAAKQLRGEVAIACARRAYAIFRQIAASKRFQVLARAGARMQRLLWASTGTKNPAYGAVKYIEPLIGPDTVTTMPLETLEAYEHQGSPAPRLIERQDESARTLKKLHDAGIDLAEVADRLLAEGIDKFVEPYDATCRAIDDRRRNVVAERA